MISILLSTLYLGTGVPVALSKPMLSGRLVTMPCNSMHSKMHGDCHDVTNFKISRRCVDASIRVVAIDRAVHIQAFTTSCVRARNNLELRPSWSSKKSCDRMPAALAPPASLLFFASLRNAASLKAVLDLVDKDYSQDAGAAVCLLPCPKPILHLTGRAQRLAHTPHASTDEALRYVQCPSTSVKMDCRYI